MKSAEIKNNSDAELVALAGDLSKKLWKARFDNHSNQLDKTSSISAMRRDIARIKTEQTRRAGGKHD